MKDIEYMLTSTSGLESVLFSSNKLMDVGKFCHLKYSSIKTYSSKGCSFLFEGKPVRIEKIDMNANYEHNRKEN